MREDETSETLLEISSENPIPYSHITGKKWGRGKGRISQKRHINRIPVSPIKFLVHWLIVFYLGLSHSPLNGLSLAQSFLGTAAKWIMSKQNFEHITLQIQGQHGTIIIFISTLSFWFTKPFLLTAHHNLNNYMTRDSLSSFHYLLSPCFVSCVFTSSIC